MASPPAVGGIAGFAHAPGKMDGVALVHEEGVDLHARRKVAQFLLLKRPRHDGLSGDDKKRIVAGQVHRPIRHVHTGRRARRILEDLMPRPAAIEAHRGTPAPEQQKIFPVHVHQP